MRSPNRTRKSEVKSINHLQLNEEQKEAKRLIIENQVVVITGQAGSGKSLICAQVALDFITQKMCDEVCVTRATIEVGRSLGYIPGEIEDKFNPYIEGFVENMIKLTNDRGKINDMVSSGIVKGFPLQFIRGKTIDDLLIVEEAQNLTKHEMLAILTRLGKTGKIIINGDNNQMDIRTPTDEINGLSYVLNMTKRISAIKTINLKENHRSGLVGEILNYAYGKS